MKYHIITLGCPKNTVDSENMMALLNRSGLEYTPEPGEAEAIIVNTCTFIHDARVEAIDTIFEIHELARNTGARIIVTGCLAQRYKDEIANSFSEVDSWMGLEKLENIVSVVKKSIEGEKIRKYYNPCPGTFENLPRFFTTPPHFGYLKIAEGCSHSCNFCIIPQIRGKFRSLPMEDIILQAEELIKTERRELVLIAQDTTLYGVDLYGKQKLPELLKRLANLEGVEWVRLMYAYPDSLNKEILQTIADEPRICNYLDIPLQHSHPAVLKKMGRSNRGRETVEAIKEIIPEAEIRTAFIVGHPGETEKRFHHLVNFVEEYRFYNLGVFTYSPEENTVSAGFKARASGVQAERRRDILMSLQQDIAFELRREKEGKILTAVCSNRLNFIENPGLAETLENAGIFSPDQLPDEVTAIGRTVYDAPDIDGLLFIKGTPPAENEFFKARIEEGLPYDLIGSPFS
ncbi:MAG: 30S ribosomal protein S12 methylthiotransferase RimO [Vulcanimicrobiota bacterium]